MPFPESLDNWPVENEQEAFDLNNSYNELIEYLKSDAAQAVPDLAAELQAKFDCWLSASASGQFETAEQCRVRFLKALDKTLSSVINIRNISFIFILYRMFLRDFLYLFIQI
mgnify:CR=1 FL=1